MHKCHKCVVSIFTIFCRVLCEHAYDKANSYERE